MALEVFHFDISGNDINDEQPLNIPLKLVLISVLQLEISGKDFNDEHSLNAL